MGISGHFIHFSHQNSHMHFDFTPLKGLKITPSDEKKSIEGRARKG